MYLFLNNSIKWLFDLFPVIGKINCSTHLQMINPLKYILVRGMKWRALIYIFFLDSSSVTKKPSSVLLVVSNSGSDSVYSPKDPNGVGNSRSWFTYKELFEATNGFSTQNLLGEGGFGCVYKGVLSDGKEIAVKKLKIGGGQGQREFKAEVDIISRIHHRHLVSLVGYCISDNSRLLLYDYVPNNNLYFHLHGKDIFLLNFRLSVIFHYPNSKRRYIIIYYLSLLIFL